MTTLTHGHESASGGMGSAWGWLVALGVFFIALAAFAFANLPAATAASVYVVGIIMLVAAIAQLAAAFAARSWAGFGVLILSALLYGGAGVLTIANPLLAASALTLLLGISLVLSGASRIWSSFDLRPLPGWGWVTVSGVVSVIAGIVFIAGWPADTVYLLGMVLAVDLAFQGATAVGFGIALKALTK